MKRILDFFDVFFISLDGFVHNEIVHHQVGKVIDQIHEAGKTLRLLTNNPYYSRESIYAKLQKLGFKVTLEEIITPGWVLKLFLKFQRLGKIYLLGNQELRKELLDTSIEVTQHDPQAVVVGFDEAISLREIKEAAAFTIKGIPLIATNPDYQFNTCWGVVPSTGIIVDVLEKMTSTRAVCLGRPNPFFFFAALGELSLKKLRCVVIGDNPQTDIVGAHWMRMSSVLVAQHFEYFPATGDPRNPDLWVQDFEELQEKRVTELMHLDRSFQVLPNGIKVATCGIVLDCKRRVLLALKRGSKDWGLPAGTMEIGETLTGCLQRELREETGISIDPQSIICRGVFTDPEELVFTKELGKPFQFVVVVYECRALNGKPRPDGEEIREARFFALDELPSNLFPTHRKWIQKLLVASNR
jgi:HAD superfamily hydrolase (TIGR01450 family)